MFQGFDVAASHGMMDPVQELQVKPASRRCAVTDKEFAPGDTVVSLLLRGEQEYERADMLVGELPNYQGLLPQLCRWTWTVRLPENSEAAAAKAALAQSETLFMALCNSEDEGGDSSGAVDEERSALRYLLGLMLQRKRLLKPVAGRKNVFLHVASGVEVELPPVKLTPELLRRVAPQMAL